LAIADRVSRGGGKIVLVSHRIGEKKGKVHDFRTKTVMTSRKAKIQT